MGAKLRRHDQSGGGTEINAEVRNIADFPQSRVWRVFFIVRPGRAA
jgi:hypothetical protein